VEEILARLAYRANTRGDLDLEVRPIDGAKTR